MTLTKEQQIQQLLTLHTDELYHLLGTRIEAIQSDPSLGNQSIFEIESDGLEAGLSLDIRRKIQTTMQQTSQSIYKIICDDDEVNRDIRNTILQAWGLGEQVIIPLLTNYLVTHTGILEGLAIIPVVIIYKTRIVPYIELGHNNMCQVWNESFSVN